MKAIKNKKDHIKALKRIEVLWDAKLKTPQGDELDRLVTLVEVYENKRWGKCFWRKRLKKGQWNFTYDDGSDVLYCHVGKPQASDHTDESDRFSVVGRSRKGKFVGFTVINFLEMLHNLVVKK